MLSNTRKKVWVYSIPFLITAAMLLVIFYKAGIYPFGEKSLLILGPEMAVHSVLFLV